MRIVYFSDSTIPSKSANSIHVMNMCDALAHNCHDVILIARVKNKRKELDVFKYYNVTAAFKIVQIPRLNIKGLSSLYSILGALYARFISADLIYGRHLRGCCAAKVLGLNVIFETHRPVVGWFDQVLFKNMLNSNRLKRVVILSKRLKRKLQEEFNLSNDKIVVAYNAASDNDIDRYELPRADLNMISSSNKFKAGYIGHLYAGKGMEIIFELAQKCSWAVFIIIGGESKDLKYWRNKVQDHNLQNIIFYGYKPPYQINAIVGYLDVLLIPPQKEVQVFGGKTFCQLYSPPLKLFEYMRAEKAIIASNFLDEVLEHKINALLCDPGNIIEWVNALEELYKDQELKEKLAQKAREDYENYYTWTKRAERVLDGIELSS